MMLRTRGALCVIGAMVLAAVMPAAGQDKRAAPRIEHVIMVSVDGLMPEAYLAPDKHGLKVPTLREMVRAGAVSDGAESVFPTKTYPAHTSIATGANPGTHGIVDNQPFDPENKNQGGWCWYSEDIRVPTLWDAARERGLRTALVYWPVTVGAQATASMPEIWRAGTREDVKLVRALSTPGLLDAVEKRFPGFAEGFTPPQSSDASVTDVAVYLIETQKPHLLMTHLVNVDHWLHQTGPFSAESKAAIENADAQVARLIAAAKKAGIWQQTALVLVSDHGFAASRERLRLGVYLAQRGLVKVDERGQLTEWKAAVQPMTGLAYVYLKDPADERTRAQVWELFASMAGKEGSGIRHVYPPEEIAQLGGDPEAALAVGTVEGYEFAAGYSGEVFFPARLAAGHGYDPRYASMRASLVLYGPGVAAGKLEKARLIDVAPTVARWLGLRLERAEGKPLMAHP